MFDSLKCAKVLEGVGISREQAEAHMHVLSNVVDVVNDEIATKHDVAILRGRIDDLERRFDQLELRLEEKLETFSYRLQYSLLVKLGGMIAVLFGLGFTALGLLLS